MILLSRLIPRLANISLTHCNRHLSTPVLRSIGPEVIQGKILKQPTSPIVRNDILIPHRQFHARNSKVHYLDFRYRFRPNKIKKNILLIRRRKMKKHQRRKWRKKFKTMLSKLRLKREISKEKAFRVELLTIIRAAERFDPKEFALKKISEMNNIVPEPTKEDKLEELKELIRKNRYQTHYIKPKHRRIDNLLE